MDFYKDDVSGIISVMRFDLIHLTWRVKSTKLGSLVGFKDSTKFTFNNAIYTVAYERGSKNKNSLYMFDYDFSSEFEFAANLLNKNYNYSVAVFGHQCIFIPSAGNKC